MYAALLIHVQSLKTDLHAISNPTLMKGLHACQSKLEKYLDQSTSETDLYYFATCTEKSTRYTVHCSFLWV